MRLKLVGKFIEDNIAPIPNKKDPDRPYIGGNAIFEVIYEHTDPETEEVYATKYMVPFKVFGKKQCDTVGALTYEQECEIYFEAAGREDNRPDKKGTYYAENRVSVIKPLAAKAGATSAKPAPAPAVDDDIPFGH